MNPAPVTSIESVKSDARGGGRTERCRDPKNATYPFDFSVFKEGDIEPFYNKEIASLIASDYDYIVFLDKQSFVWWDLNDDVVVNKYGDALTRVAVLESIQIGDKSNIETFRRLVAEGVARLCEQNPTAASRSFDKAEEWIRARNRERARVWYLTAALLMALPLSFVMVAMIMWKDTLQGWSMWLRPSVFDVVVGACAGAIGAFLSVIRRSGNTELDISAGRKLHYVEGAVRILIGTIGAALFAVGIKANLVLGFVKPESAFSTLLVFCMVAGVSEMLVPNFIEQVEANGGTSEFQRTRKPDRGSGDAAQRGGRLADAAEADQRNGQ